jgi:hypothetical protein
MCDVRFVASCPHYHCDWETTERVLDQPNARWHARAAAVQMFRAHWLSEHVQIPEPELTEVTS